VTDRSAVLGRWPDGTLRLRTSLIGFDALNGPDEGMSFDSEWDDVLKVHAIGIATLGDSTVGYRDDVYFPDLGYSPFVEIRKLSGNIVYDDYVSDTQYGIGASIFSDRFTAGLPLGGSVIYVVFKIQVPAP